MKKFLFTGLLAILSMGLWAQSIDDIKDYLGKNQLDKAKDGIDKYLSVEKNAKKADGWFYKAYIYNAVSKDDKLKTSVADGKMESFNAYKRYLELDPKNIMGTLDQNVTLFDIYNGYFDMGAKFFNAKNFAEAFNSFRNAEMVQTYIAGKGFEYNGFKFPILDTSLVLNTAIAAMNAKKEDDAILYYQKLADAKLAGKEYQEIYKYLVEYYMKKKDAVAMKKYLDLGMQLFPADEYWIEVQLDDVNKDDKPAVFAKYEQVIGMYPGKYVLHYNYAVELFNYIYTSDKKPANAEELGGKMITQIEQALNINPKSADANMLLARHYYNQAFDFSDEAVRIKGTKPEDVKRKKDLMAKMASTLDKSIPSAENAIRLYEEHTAKLKAVEKANYKSAADILVRAYEQKKMADKVALYKKKMEDIDRQ